jgi:hypothetical protein
MKHVGDKAYDLEAHTVWLFLHVVSVSVRPRSGFGCGPGNGGQEVV